MRRAQFIVLGCCGLLGGAAAAQAPTVEKVDPPNWWADHSINPVRLLIRGQHLAGARVECPRLACAVTGVSARGTYAFADVTIPHGTQPGSYPLTLRTARGSAAVPFTVAERLPDAGRYRGFSADDVMYLIMPDRFANGSTANDEPPVSKGILDRRQGRRYHGGDLEGIRQRLPYLKDLGITALWLNPIYDNTNTLDTKEVYDHNATTAYHGYHAIDFYGVEEHFGTLAELRRLVDEAHAAGIRIILDMVANHTSAYHPWVSDMPTLTWYNGTAERHLANTWQTWTLRDPYSPEPMRRATLDGWFIDLLPDLNQNDPEVARYIIQNTLWWIGVTGIDGIRQDTWPYVPRAFWRDWMNAIHREYPTVNVVGEVLDGDPVQVAFFQGGRAQWDGIDDEVESLFDFPLFYTTRRAFAQGGSIREVAMMLARDFIYPNPDALVTLNGLHDVGRFLNERGATTAGLRLAFTFLLTARGIPLLYYGDEVNLPGGNDPDNRRDFPGGWQEDQHNAFEAAGRTPEEQATWAHVQKLLRLRAARPELRRAPMENLLVDEQAWVYRRGSSVVALNNANQPAVLRLPVAEFGTALPAADALGVCGAPVVAEGYVTISIPARAGCVF